MIFREQLFINMQSKSHIFDPIQTFTAPLKTGLAPPELMLGCHKTSTDLTYRHFADGEFDEFASWNRSLGDDNIINFMGGFGELLLLNAGSIIYQWNAGVLCKLVYAKKNL